MPRSRSAADVAARPTIAIVLTFMLTGLAGPIVGERQAQARPQPSTIAALGAESATSTTTFHVSVNAEGQVDLVLGSFVDYVASSSAADSYAAALQTFVLAHPDLYEIASDFDGTSLVVQRVSTNRRTHGMTSVHGYQQWNGLRILRSEFVAAFAPDDTLVAITGRIWGRTDYPGRQHRRAMRRPRPSSAWSTQL